jgi:hypothetical protein
MFVFVGFLDVRGVAQVSNFAGTERKTIIMYTFARLCFLTERCRCVIANVAADGGVFSIDTNIHQMPEHVTIPMLTIGTAAGAKLGAACTAAEVSVTLFHQHPDGYSPDDTFTAGVDRPCAPATPPPPRPTFTHNAVRTIIWGDPPTDCKDSEREREERERQ